MTTPTGRSRGRGFTLLELLVVLSIMAMATASVVVALRDSGGAQLEREAQRLAALLEAGRAQSRASGVPVRWQAVSGGFRFEGTRSGALPSQWLQASTVVRGPDSLLLGPEPLLPAQSVVLTDSARPGTALRVGTDGLRPFTVEAVP